jgi:hypothetical protein
MRGLGRRINSVRLSVTPAALVGEQCRASWRAPTRRMVPAAGLAEHRSDGEAMGRALTASIESLMRTGQLALRRALTEWVVYDMVKLLNNRT